MTKKSNEIEVFLFSDSSPSIDLHKKEKHNKLKNINKPLKFSVKSVKTETDEKSTVSNISEKNFEDSIEPVISSSKSSSSSISFHEVSKEGKGEKIIDTEFGTVHGPKFIYRETPQYPQIARRLGKEGRVVLRLTINEKGELLNIEVLESASYGFTESAIEAVKKSKFAPAIKDGKPIACRAILPIRFILKN